MSRGPAAPRLVQVNSADRPTWHSRAWPAALGTMGALIAGLLLVGVDSRAGAMTVALVAFAVALVVVAWALIANRRQRRAYEDRLTAWVHERAATAERLRIARDLHDLASHGLGLMTIRAAAARGLDGPEGERERLQALADIERAGHEATTELRRMLTVLRSPDDTVPWRPAASLADLPGLIEASQAMGVRVRWVADELEDVSAGVQVALYAVVREALANSARHAGPTSADVAVRRDGDALIASVRDEGPVEGWIPHRGAGHGLAGLHERISALGGSLIARDDDGGFLVIARVPDPAGTIR